MVLSVMLEELTRKVETLYCYCFFYSYIEQSALSVCASRCVVSVRVLVITVLSIVYD